MRWTEIGGFSVLLALGGCPSGNEAATSRATPHPASASLSGAATSLADPPSPGTLRPSYLGVAPTTPSVPQTLTPQPTSPADDSSPLELVDVRLSRQSAPTEGQSISVEASAVVHRKLDYATYVHAKGVCRVGHRVLADTGYVNPDYQRPLGDRSPGERVELRGALFPQGLDENDGPCQIEFRLASPGGVTRHLQDACSRDGTTTPGTCTPPIVAPSPSSGGRPLEILALDVAPQEGFGARGSLQADYLVEVRAPQDDSSRLTLKASCTVGDTRFAVVRMTHLMAGPFRYAAGEAVARRATLFYDPSFGFATPPSECDLKLSLWTRTEDQTGAEIETELHQACYREGKTRRGHCPARPDAPDAPPPTDGVAIRLQGVDMEVLEPTAGKAKRFQLRVQADATVVEAVEPGAGVVAIVTCKVGKTARVETTYLHGVELHYLEAGETARLSGTTFASTSMESEPHSCEARFTLGRRFSPVEHDEVELGRWCLRRGTTAAGACGS